MKEYLITVAVEAKGHQQFIVEAESQEDAIRKFQEDGSESEFVGEELEVTSMKKSSAKAEPNE